MRRLALLSGAVALLMAFASAVGLLADGVYRDNALVRAGWLGNDTVTLVLAVPLLLAAAHRLRSSRPALIVCLGLLGYAAYDYAFYLFGAAFNGLFLVYVAILVCSTLGLIDGFASPEARHIAEAVSVGRLHRPVGGLVVTISALLGLFWTVTSASFLVTGQTPPMVTATDHPTNITGALDLWLVVTFGLLGGAWLIQGRGWGYVVSAVWLVKGAVYMTALSAASVTAVTVGPADELTQLTLWVPIGLACGVGAGVLLAGLSGERRPLHPPSGPR